MIDQIKQEAEMFMDGAFWYESSFHEWFQRPIAWKTTGCEHCGADVCEYNCDEFFRTMTEFNS